MTPRTYHPSSRFSFFFFNDTATTEIYTLSLHDALPISMTRAGYHEWRDDLAKFHAREAASLLQQAGHEDGMISRVQALLDRKSTRLNSSHLVISYAVFCLKTKRHTVRRGRDTASQSVVD